MIRADADILEIPILIPPDFEVVHGVVVDID